MKTARSRATAAVAACGWALLAATHAHASGTQRLDVVEVRGAADELGTSDAASSGRVEAPALANRPIATPGEILEAIPGLVVTQHSGGGKANQYFLRGFNLDHGTDFATYVDGMPINMRTHGHGQGYTDLSFLIPELVGSIVYKKGPYDAEEGDFSTTGVARLSLVDRFADHTAKLTAGRFGYARGLFTGTTGVATGNLTYGFAALANDGPWTQPEDLRRLNGVLRFARGEPANGFSITAMAYDGRWTATDQIPRRAVESNLLGRFDTLDPTDGGKSSRYSLSTRWTRSNASGVTQANAYLINSKLDLFSNFTYFLNDPINGDQFRQRDSRTLGGIDLSNTFLSAWGERTSETTIGMQSRADVIRVGLANTAARAVTSGVRDDRVRQESVGAFAQNRTTWTPWLRTLAGVRLDTFQANVSSDTQDNSGRARANLASPKAGLVLGPWARTEVFLHWGRGFHSNDARGATITIDPASGSPADRSPLLVRSSGSEIGLRSAPTRDLVTSLALFKVNLDSELVFIGDAGNTEATRATERVGIEWSGRWSIARWIAFDWQAASTRARYVVDEGAGTRIPNAPDRVLAAGIEAREGRFTGALRLRYVGRRALTEDGTVKSSASTLVSALARYTVSKSIALELEGFNLTARRTSQIEYFYDSRLRTEAAGVSDVHFHPVEPRLMRVSLIARF